MPEAEGRRGLDQEIPASNEIGEMGWGARTGLRRQDIEQWLGGEPLAGDRRHADHRQLLRGKGLEALADQSDRRVGHRHLREVRQRHPAALAGRQRPRLRQQREDLLDRERIPTRARGDAGGDPGLRGAEELADEHRRIVGTERCDPHGRHTVHVTGRREDDQQWRVARGRRDVAQKPHESRPDAVRVVDLDQRGGLHGDLDQSPEHPPKEIRIRCPVEGEDRAQLRQDPVRVGVPVEELGQAVADVGGRRKGIEPREGLDEIGQRPAGATEVGGRAGDRAVSHVIDRPSELGNEPGLADAGFAGDHEAGGSPLGGGPFEAGPKVIELPVAAHQRTVPSRGGLECGRRCRHRLGGDGRRRLRNMRGNRLRKGAKTWSAGAESARRRRPDRGRSPATAPEPPARSPARSLAGALS